MTNCEICGLTIWSNDKRNRKYCPKCSKELILKKNSDKRKTITQCIDIMKKRYRVENVFELYDKLKNGYEEKNQ